MDKTLERKIRRLGPTPIKVLEYVMNYQTPTSAGTASVMGSDPKSDVGRQVGGGYSVLSRNNFVEPVGRDASGSLRWAPTEIIEQNKTQILELIKKIK